MNKNEWSESGFVVYGFMVGELGLSGIKLLIYALIYSFKKSGLTYYGTQEYLSDRIGCSLASVKRSLKALTDAKLITKVYENGSRMPIYTINELAKNNKNDKKDGSKMTVNFEPLKGSFCTSEELIFTPKNKERIKNTSSTTSSKSACAQRKNSSISFLKYGVEGLVTMTEEQYDDLCSSLGEEMAQTYIGRLETYLISNPAVCLKNHYKAIQKWAREDASV